MSRRDISEEPRDEGFGDAALNLSRYFVLLRPGCPVAGARFTFSIHFVPGDQTR